MHAADRMEFWFMNVYIPYAIRPSGLDKYERTNKTRDWALGRRGHGRRLQTYTESEK